MLAPLVAGAIARGQLRVDLENRTMKAPDAAEMALEARRTAEFGPDDAVVMLLEPRNPAAAEAGADADVQAWLDELRTLPAVTGLRTIGVPGQPGAVLAVADVGAGGADGARAAAVRQLAELARARAPATHALRVSGQLLGEIAIAEALVAEQRRIVPVILGGLLALLLLAWRSAALAVGALLPALAGILALTVLQAALDLPIDPASALLAPVLLTVGVAGSVHLIEAWRRRLRAGADHVAASHGALRDLRKPALLAVATTIAGFAGLLPSPVPAVARFGMLAAVGCALCAGIALLALPPWLRLLGGPSARRVARRPTQPWRLAGPGTAVLVRNHAAAVSAVALLATVLAGVAIAHVRVDTEPLRILAPRDPVRRDAERIGAVIGGTEVFDLLVEGRDPALAGLRSLTLQAQVTALAGVVAPTGAVRTAPSGSRLFSFLLAPGGTTQRERVFTAAEDAARELGFRDVHATGAAVRVARDSTALVRGQLRGLAFTLGFLWLAMLLGFRSLRLATLGLLPNILPCLLLYGALGLFGIPLSVGTAMVGSVMLGLVVDDTIHFLHGYREARVSGGGRTTAIARALLRCGRALTISSVVLAAGFATGLLGELQTTREFAALAAGTIVAAWFADVIVLPAILLVGRRAGARSAPTFHRPCDTPLTHTA